MQKDESFVNSWYIQSMTGIPHIGEISSLLTAFFWTGSALAFAAATVRVGSVYVNVSRLIFALVMLFVAILFLRGMDPVSFSQIVFLFLSGLVGFVFGDTFLFKSFEYISARISMLIMALAPAFAAFLSFVFLNETLSIISTLGICVTLFGIGLVIFEGKERTTHTVPISLEGVLYALLGAIGQAGGLVLAKKAFGISAINGVQATCIRVVGATVVIVPLNYFAGRFVHPIQAFKNDGRALWFTLLGAFLGPFAGVSFSLVAISFTKVGIASTLMATTPIFMLPAVWILYREKLSWRAIAGACIAAAGVGILFLL